MMKCAMMNSLWLWCDDEHLDEDDKAANNGLWHNQWSAQTMKPWEQTLKWWKKTLK